MYTPKSVIILDQISKYLRTILVIIILYIAYSIATDIQKNSDYNKMYMCDWFAHNQEMAPSICK